MLHRHLNHQGYSLAAIDDVIGRGKWDDWTDLRNAALRDPTLFAKIIRVCRAHADDSGAIRYHFWKHYAERHAS